MFKIVTSPRAWWPVTFSGVAEDGTILENEFSMLFRILDEDQYTVITGRALKIAGQADEDMVDADGKALRFSQIAAPFVMELAHDWRDVGYENGDPMRFELENVEILVRVPNVWTAIWQAYRACRAAAPKARAGN